MLFFRRRRDHVPPQTRGAATPLPCAPQSLAVLWRCGRRGGMRAAAWGTATRRSAAEAARPGCSGGGLLFSALLYSCKCTHMMLHAQCITELPAQQARSRVRCLRTAGWERFLGGGGGGGGGGVLLKAPPFEFDFRYLSKSVNGDSAEFGKCCQRVCLLRCIINYFRYGGNQEWACPHIVLPESLARCKVTLDEWVERSYPWRRGAELHPVFSVQGGVVFQRQENKYPSRVMRLLPLFCRCLSRPKLCCGKAKSKQKLESRACRFPLLWSSCA
jgi:hypothetical protein